MRQSYPGDAQRGHPGRDLGTRRTLGRNGLTFENSLAPNPLCCPAWASLLTGQHSHNDGVFHSLRPYGFGSFVWEDYLHCRGQRCVAPLPAELQADPTQERRLTTSFWRQVDAVHGY